jgi:hypothetical protein
LRGEAKYKRLASICRDYGVLTPEDPYAVWSGVETEYLIAPFFLLYDYSFRPDDIPLERAVEWADEVGVICADEVLLHAEPYSALFTVVRHPTHGGLACSVFDRRSRVWASTYSRHTLA